ncbi:MAG: hypothetical protein ABIH89_08045 [Elusimicrobiota bacterium]
MKRPFLIILILMCGCATTPAVKKGFNFGSYGRIGVIKFVSNSSYRESGNSVSDEFIRQLMKREKQVFEIVNPMSDSIYSYQIMAGGYKVDGIITGTVTKYVPDGEDTVYLKNDEGKIVSEMFIKESEVGVSAKFIDGATGVVLWSDSYTYSGFSVDDTINSVVSVIVRRLEKNRYERK